MRNKSVQRQARRHQALIFTKDMIHDLAGFTAMVTLVLGVAALGMMIH